MSGVVRALLGISVVSSFLIEGIAWLLGISIFRYINETLYQYNLGYMVNVATNNPVFGFAWSLIITLVDHIFLILAVICAILLLLILASEQAEALPAYYPYPI